MCNYRLRVCDHRPTVRESNSGVSDRIAFLSQLQIQSTLTQLEGGATYEEEDASYVAAMRVL